MKLKRKHDQIEQDTFEVVNIQDKYADLLPQRCPERYSFFRYIAYRLMKNGKPYSFPRARLTLRISHPSTPQPMELVVMQSFKGGVYYFQNVALYLPCPIKFRCLNVWHLINVKHSNT